MDVFINIPRAYSKLHFWLVMNSHVTFQVISDWSWTAMWPFRWLDVPCNPLEKVGYILDAITHYSYKIETWFIHHCKEDILNFLLI